MTRANTFAPGEANGGSASVEKVDVQVQDWSQAAKLVGHEEAERGAVDITQADVLVAGGRGLGGPESFALCERLAKALGGEVAATRAVVDAGWYPYAAQVGQTGKTVAPKLYIACGISGAIQHKVGMVGAETIVAINKDPNAPIFEYADLGVVGTSTRWCRSSPSWSRAARDRFRPCSICGSSRPCARSRRTGRSRTRPVRCTSPSPRSRGRSPSSSGRSARRWWCAAAPASR